MAPSDTMQRVASDEFGAVVGNTKVYSSTVKLQGHSVVPANWTRRFHRCQTPPPDSWWHFEPHQSKLQLLQQLF